MNWNNLQEVLVWLAGIGAPAVVMYVLSWVVENWAGWSLLPKNVKFIIPLVVSVLISFGASELLKYPDIISGIQPWFQVIMSSILAYLASQKAYVTAMSKGYGARFVRPDSKNAKMI